MHEASLVQGLLKIALKTVEEHNAAHPEQRVRRIRSITCELGLISCVEPQTLKGCFEIFARDGMADGAELILRTAPCPAAARIADIHSSCSDGISSAPTAAATPYASPADTVL